MTKERFLELLRSTKPIYEIISNKVELVDKTHIVPLDNRYNQNHYRYYTEPCSKYLIRDVKDLFETKEEAEWHLKTYTERTERFEPPMWEEIEKGVKDGYTFCFIGKNGYFYCFCVEKERINKIYMNYEMDVHNEVFDMEATKENYEKACEIVRELFKEVK